MSSTMNEVTHALSLSRPWCFAITDCGKRIENRDWPIPKRWMGKRIALHVAKSWDEDGREFIQSLGFKVPTKAECPHS